MSFLSNLNWRYATKKYDSTKSVSREDLDKILTAIQMAPSSGGSQPYHIIITAGELKDKLFDDNKQVDKKGSTYLLVFCARNDFPERGEAFVDIVSEKRGIPREELEGLRKTVLRPAELEDGERMKWSAKQTYIALGFALAGCAELGIDSSPMEGFDPSSFHKILNLPEYMMPVALLALGYRDPNDRFTPANAPKARFSKTDLFEERNI